MSRVFLIPYTSQPASFDFSASGLMTETHYALRVRVSFAARTMWLLVVALVERQ